MTAIAAHPEADQVLNVGTANGGIWRTVNVRAGSPHWSPLTDRVAIDLDPFGDAEGGFLPLSIGG